MELYTAIAFITVGIALVSGIINLLSGLSADGEKTELVFGILLLCIVVFLLLPPVGYIIDDKAPYSLGLDIKRIFIWSHYALLPVFFEYYSGYKKPFIKYSIWGLLIASYFAMAFASQDSAKPLWVMIALVMFFVVGWYGFAAAINQIKKQKKSEGKWLLASMIIYSILYLLGVFNQLGDNYFGRLLGSKLFFPIHFNMIAFILIMSIRLRTNTREKYELEKILRWRDARWDSLVENMHLLIVELDKNGVVRYINPFAVTTLDFQFERNLLNKNWFDQVLEISEADSVKRMYMESMREGKLTSGFSHCIFSKFGKALSVNWTTVFVYDKKGQINGTMNIGVDVTKQENAYKQVQALKDELQKENLTLKGLRDPLEMDDEIIGTSDNIIYAINKARQVATTNAGVLLQGETGVGKELFANFIHKHSYRNDKPLIKVNCAALPADLIESELFGHEKGSFTGAVNSRTGRFELANDGTIFLDEIGELPLSLQSKLLRVLQNGEFERIGGQKTIKVDVRVIAATNRDLLDEAKSKKFREDLFYRLNVFPITIPPLRTRKEDIPLLVATFVRKLCEQHHKTIENISKADMTRLTEYEWPGNIREMINLLERSIISSNERTLRLDWLQTSPVSILENDGYDSIHEIERIHVMKILRECNWKINGQEGAAFRLGLHPSTLRSRLKKMNITRSDDE